LNVHLIVQTKEELAVIIKNTFPFNPFTLLFSVHSLKADWAWWNSIHCPLLRFADENVPSQKRPREYPCDEHLPD
jgi:hypothetical protein